jgi:hypothetical protein
MSLLSGWQDTFRSLSKALSFSSVSTSDVTEASAKITESLTQIHDSYNKLRQNMYWEVTTTTERTRPFYHAASYSKRWKRR